MELKTISDFREESEKARKKKLAGVLKLAKKHSPISYERFVHLVYLEVGLPYLQNQKRGVYNKEVDSLIAVGKLRLKNKTIYYVRKKEGF